MMMEEEDAVSNINFISCVQFIKQGVAKEKPDKVTLTKEELARIITETKGAIRDAEESDEDEDGESGDENAVEDDMEVESNENQRPQADTRPGDDEFNLANYDEEDSAPLMGIGDVAIVDDDHDLEDDENDSEAEDDKITPKDNLILVGHVDDDSVCMEVYVWNEEEGSLYVHHDFFLPSYPLCIEWFDHDPGSDQPGNMCAIGSMDPVITIWDLDIQDSLEPTFKLGSKGNRKKKVAKSGHKDAVLDLSWNPEYPHILASASVDQTVILWDLDEGKASTTITAFSEKVQAVKFHPQEPHQILSGSCDGAVKLFDCRDLNTINTAYKSWMCDSEIEKVLWNRQDPNYFLVGTQSGKVCYFDRRHETNPLWIKLAHEMEVSGLALNEKVPKILTTTSADGYMKVWEFDSAGARMVQEEDMKIGRIHSLSYSPESPNIVAIGGDNKKRHFRVVNLWEYDSVKHTFQG